MGRTRNFGTLIVQADPSWKAPNEWRTSVHDTMGRTVTNRAGTSRHRSFPLSLGKVLGVQAVPQTSSRAIYERLASTPRSAPSLGVAGGRQSTVEIEGGADEGQVRERLREVAEVLRLKPQLLAE